MTGHELSHSCHPNRKSRLRLRTHGGRSRLELEGAARAMLRTFRAQRRGQDDHNEVSAQSAPSAARAGARIRPRSGAGRSRREGPAGLRAGPGGVLSVDERSRDARLPGVFAAICPETDLLVLDEPTSGLDPIVRREFIETVIGAYQEGNPGNRTIFVSTHLITEFEGLIDEFTIIDRGRVVVTLDSDQARERFQKIRARFAQSTPELDLKAALRVRREGRELELIVNGAGPELLERLRQHNPEALTTESLTMEEIFFASLKS